MTQQTQTNPVDLTKIKTMSGKTITDFEVPEKLKTEEPELVKLILESEAMDDGEKQYWFNLTKVMNPAQKERLYDILRRERQKLDEIRGKAPKVDDVEAQKKAIELAQKRAEQQALLAEKEKKAQAQEDFNEDDLLESVNW